jgi:hypothetical protein
VLAFIQSSVLVLQLASGAVNAAYLSGSGTKVLRFKYTVQPLDYSPDLDYVPATPGSPAVRACLACLVETSTEESVYLNSLPAPGQPGSLGANNNLVIDGDALLVVSTRTTTPNGTYGAGEELAIVVRMLQPVHGHTALALTLSATDVGGVNIVVPLDR